MTVKASGAPDDDAAARADAIKVATEVKAFASFGGPSETEAYAQELAARGVLCLGDCMLAVVAAVRRQRRARTTSGSRFPSVDQSATHWANFVTRELDGPPGAVRRRRRAHEAEARVRRSCASTSPSPGSSRPGKPFVNQLRSSRA